MIEVKNMSKDFVSQKKYPGLKGAIKGLFSNEKTIKKAVDDISFTIDDGEAIGVEWIIALVFCVIAYALFSKGTKIYESAGN